MRSFPFLFLWLALVLCPLFGAYAIEPSPAVPAAVAADWTERPEIAATAAHRQADDTAKLAAEPIAFWPKALAWAGGAIGLVIAVSKFVPGLGGAVAQIAGPIYDLVVSKQVRDSEKRRDALASGMEIVMHLLEQIKPNTPAGEIKRRLSQRLPAAAQDAVNEWLREREKSSPTIVVPLESFPLPQVPHSIAS